MQESVSVEVKEMLQTVIGVMGSGKVSWEQFANPLGEWIARKGFHLITGSGAGVMATASEAFCKVEDRIGLCIGVVPTEPSEEYGFVPKMG